jgi:hypothetical protein
MRVYGPLSGARRLKYGILDDSGREITYCPDPKRPYIRRGRRFASVAAAERFITTSRTTSGNQENQP